MPYGIMHIEKRGRSAVYGIQIEANRTVEDHERGRDFDKSDIDWSRTGENVYLNKTDNWNAEITRQIKDAGVKPRKNSIVLLDGIYTASPEWFENKTREEIEEYFKACLYFHLKYYCQGDASRCINAVIHYDETTPHLHVASIPIAVDSKYHLSADMIMGNRNAYRKRQDAFYEEVTKSRGMERGELVQYVEREEEGRIIMSRAEDAKLHTTKREWQIAVQEQMYREAVDRTLAEQAKVIELQTHVAELEQTAKELRKRSKIIKKELPELRKERNELAEEINSLIDEQEDLICENLAVAKGVISRSRDLEKIRMR